jgi:hypothetical protein
LKIIELFCRFIENSVHLFNIGWKQVHTLNWVCAAAAYAGAAATYAAVAHAHTAKISLTQPSKSGFGLSLPKS